MQAKLSLNEAEWTEAHKFVRQGKANARTLTRAWILLKLADGWDEGKIAETFAVTKATVKNVAQRFAEGGLELVLHDQVQQRRRQALTGQQAAHLIAITCSPAPDGHDHWCLPTVGGEFVAAMEDVLDLYEEDYDPQYPTVYLDEKPVVLHADVQPPVPVEPGKPERVDYEYERRGTRNLFVMVEPLAGWRHVEVTEQRTMQDYARIVRWLVDEVYPQAEYIRLVQDNLNTHTPASLYETFPPAEARRILQRVEFHYTPKHGSWLNMAEIEIAIFERNALSRRLPDEEALRRQVSAVETERNQQHRGISWQLTSRDARVKLSRLYPVKDPGAE